MSFYTIPTLLSLLRVPLALLFLQDDVWLRFFAITLAMITDGLDGLLARRWGCVSKVGTMVDPLTDKFFVSCALFTLLGEGALQPWQAVLMLSRDTALFFFAVYLMWRGAWKAYQFHAFWCGKITTCLQLIVLILLVFKFPVPNYLYFLFFILGILAFLELYLSHLIALKENASKKNTS